MSSTPNKVDRALQRPPLSSEPTGRSYPLGPFTKDAQKLTSSHDADELTPGLLRLGHSKSNLTEGTNRHTTSLRLE